MSSKFQTSVFLFAVLSLSGIALAQQARGNGGQSATHADAILQGADKGRVRVPGPVRLRYAQTGCTTGTCGEPPRQSEQTEAVIASDACSSLGTARDRSGRIIRRLCAFN
ncbi:hypothetical protein [Bosea sp. (in: a-proteobacteria)]|uniref:hypothetical protein n=1 Tax=Bosea sp. (in: a-proteobacteria) TaxID=1871050 RepID=UPI0026111115|nr:hypothetical protein [Bosea sp. (in: a-proteobacteria)]MCO5093277.1 hypothetical protein [Bosea sp. (in: a-proteobacteria)]